MVAARLALLLALAACRAPAAGSFAAAPLAWQTIAKVSTSGITGSPLHLARTAAEWDALWRAHAGLTIPPPPAPAVDLEREMVVCVCLGERPTAGYAVDIQTIHAEGDRLVVEAIESRPAAGSRQAAMVTRPCHLVRTARSALRAELVLR